MRAEVVAMTGECLNHEALKRAGEILKNGGLVAFPTETVYGLGGDALNPQASKKIYAAKGRPSDNPLIVHIADMDSLYRIVKTVPEKARILAGKYWPGPLTMIFQKSDIVPMEATGGLDSVAVRFPSDPVAAALIRAAGGYVAAPSANTSGRPSPTTAQHVEEDLGDAIDMILDGGQVGIGLESTIVDFTEDVPVVLRPGYISLEMLQEILGEVRMASDYRQQCSSKSSGNEIPSLCAKGGSCCCGRKYRAGNRLYKPYDRRSGKSGQTCGDHCHRRNVSFVQKRSCAEYRKQGG